MFNVTCISMELSGIVSSRDGVTSVYLNVPRFLGRGWRLSCVRSCGFKIRIGIAHLMDLMTQSIMHDLKRHTAAGCPCTGDGTMPDYSKIFETKRYDVVIYIACMLSYPK
jgi:hypothetical protein